MRYTQKIISFSSHPNLGLLYQKYCPYMWNYIDGKHQKDTEKERAFHNDMIALSKNAYVKSLTTRREKLICMSDIALEMCAVSNFFVGSGYINTTEWGLSFDWTSGLSYMPGSSLKGALLAYLEFLADGTVVQDWKPKTKDENEQIKDKSPEELFKMNDPEKGIWYAVKLNDKVKDKDDKEYEDIWTKKDIINVFGPQGDIKDSEGKQAGVIFFDVLPVHFEGFELEVITPHYTKYYEKHEDNPPADIYSPVPNHFLTIKAGSKFQFAFKNIDSYVGIDKLENLIKEAGNYWGFGAKTSSGYGMFV